jgi:hypothetical protein
VALNAPDEVGNEVYYLVYCGTQNDSERYSWWKSVDIHISSIASCLSSLANLSRLYCGIHLSICVPLEYTVGRTSIDDGRSKSVDVVLLHSFDS